MDVTKTRLWKEEWGMENEEHNGKMNWEIESFYTNFLECEINFFSSDYQYSFIF